MNDTNSPDLLRLSKKEMLVLEMLIGSGEMYGLEMVENSEGELKRGTIYVTLQRLADKGVVESREEPREFPEIGIPRRKFRATGLGQRAFQANVIAREFLSSDLVWGNAV